MFASKKAEFVVSAPSGVREILCSLRMENKTDFNFNPVPIIVVAEEVTST